MMVAKEHGWTVMHGPAEGAQKVWEILKNLFPKGS